MNLEFGTVCIIVGTRFADRSFLLGRWCQFLGPAPPWHEGIGQVLIPGFYRRSGSNDWYILRSHLLPVASPGRLLLMQRKGKIDVAEGSCI